MEKLEQDVGKYLPEVTEDALTDDVVKLDLNTMTMDELRAALSKYPDCTNACPWQALLLWPVILPTLKC